METIRRAPLPAAELSDVAQGWAGFMDDALASAQQSGRDVDAYLDAS